MASTSQVVQEQSGHVVEGVFVDKPIVEIDTSLTIRSNKFTYKPFLISLETFGLRAR